MEGKQRDPTNLKRNELNRTDTGFEEQGREKEGEFEKKQDDDIKEAISKSTKDLEIEEYPYDIDEFFKKQKNSH